LTGGARRAAPALEAAVRGVHPGPRDAGGEGPLRTAQLDYELPARLIATRPAEPRDSARLLVVRRGEERLEHATVADLPAYLVRGDVLVFNRTSVLPARLHLRRQHDYRRVEGLFLEEPAPGLWSLMLAGSRRLRVGQRLELLDRQEMPAALWLELRERDGPAWRAQLAGAQGSHVPGAAGVLERVGTTPIPPYIRRARRGAAVDDALDRRWYQTVYADERSRRSVAAPTAGLHFTPRLLEALGEAGVRSAGLFLDIGPGTFRPVTAPTLSGHVMDPERYVVPPQTLRFLHEAAAAHGGGRIVAVGTTVVRTLESLPDPLPDPGTLDGPLGGETDLLIAPPRQLRRVQGLLTNFHLPRSTLLALVAAVVGLERVLAIYREAVRMGYRFYSYGDAMLILP
jgi:S-adenosylmethionine:tRNA ribosyltransferase-isomerase